MKIFLAILGLLALIAIADGSWSFFIVLRVTTFFADLARWFPVTLAAICSNPSSYRGQVLCYPAGQYCGQCVSFVKVCSRDYVRVHHLTPRDLGLQSDSFH